jgi:hypothetical protein
VANRTGRFAVRFVGAAAMALAAGPDSLVQILKCAGCKKRFVLSMNFSNIFRVEVKNVATVEIVLS